jgi:hypothetical protein
MRKLAAIASVAVVTAFGAGTALAHNAGHVILPDGSCQDVGSGRPAPAVAAQNPNQAGGYLDLEPGPGDQYGARFAADQGLSQVEPRFCAEVGLIPRN